MEPPDTGDSAQLSVRLLTTGEQARQGAPIRAGDVLHFHVTLDGPAERARLAVATTPRNALASVACEDTAGTPSKPASRPQICDLGEVARTRTVDVTMEVPREADEVGVTAVAQMRDPGGVQWVRRMADVKLRVRKPSGELTSLPTSGKRPSQGTADPEIEEQALTLAPLKGGDPGPGSAPDSAGEATTPEVLVSPGSSGPEHPKDEHANGEPADGQILIAGAAKGEAGRGDASKGEGTNAQGTKGEVGDESPATPVTPVSPGPADSVTPVTPVSPDPAGSVPKTDSENLSDIQDKKDKAGEFSGVDISGKGAARPDEVVTPKDALALAGAGAEQPAERVIELTAVPPQTNGMHQVGAQKLGSGPQAPPGDSVRASRHPSGKPKASPVIPHPAPGIPAEPAKGSVPAPVTIPQPAPMPVRAPVPAPVQAPPVAPLSAGIQMPMAAPVPPIAPAPAQVPGAVPPAGAAPVPGVSPAPAQAPAPGQAQVPGQAPLPGAGVPGQEVPGRAPAAVPGAPDPAMGAPLPQEIRPEKRELVADADHDDSHVVRGLPAAIAAVVLLLAALALQLKLRRRRLFRKL